MDDKDFINLMGELRSKTKPSVCNISFAISAIDGEGIIISIEDNSLIESDFFDGSLLRDNITEENTIPSAPGFYIGKIRIHSFRNNHPQDPTEWDMTISLEEVQLIVRDNKTGKIKHDESGKIQKEPIDNYPNYHDITRSGIMSSTNYHGLNE